MNIKQLKTFTDILDVLERRSTCYRLQVAALLVSDDRIISSGWNGVPSNHKECKDVFNGYDINSEEFKQAHTIFSLNNELHAEQNCIGYAARHGIKTANCDMVITLSPCTQCAKLIIAAGIKSIFYKRLYDRNPEAVELLKQSKIHCSQIEI